MAFFQGNIIPTAYKRLAKLYAQHPEFVKVKEGDEFWPILQKASDLLDDNIINKSDQFSMIPITGIESVIDITEYDIGAGNIITGKITSNVIPSDTTQDVIYTFVSSDTNVVTVDNDGNITAIGEGTATIIAGIQNTSFTKEFNITVLNT